MVQWLGYLIEDSLRPPVQIWPGAALGIRNTGRLTAVRKSSSSRSY